MKTILFSLVFLFLPKICVSQVTTNDKIIYLDSLWEETTIENSNYLRVIKDYVINQKKYLVRDYYSSGKIQMEGRSESKDKLVKTGQFTYYFENGNRQKIIAFKKNLPIRICYELYENGNKKQETEYIEGRKNEPTICKIKNYWDENERQQVIDGNGIYESKEKDFYTIGKLKNGLKDSIWIGWFDKSKIKFVEEYKDGKFFSGISTDENNNSKPYLEVVKRPVPKRGMNHFYLYISKNLKFASEGLQGKTSAQFDIDTEGKIVNIKVLNSEFPEFDKAIENTISSYENWIPAEMRGVKKKVTFALPLTILNQ